MARTEEEQKALRKERNRRYYEKHKGSILEKVKEYQNDNDRKEYYKEYNKTRNDSNDESPDNAHKRWTGKDRVKLFRMKILQEKSVKDIAEELQRSEKSIRHELVNDRNNEIIKKYNEQKEYYEKEPFRKKIHLSDDH